MKQHVVVYTCIQQWMYALLKECCELQCYHNCQVWWWVEVLYLVHGSCTELYKTVSYYTDTPQCKTHVMPCHGTCLVTKPLEVGVCKKIYTGPAEIGTITSWTHSERHAANAANASPPFHLKLVLLVKILQLKHILNSHILLLLMHQCCSSSVNDCSLCTAFTDVHSHLCYSSHSEDRGSIVHAYLLLPHWLHYTVCSHHVRTVPAATK